MDIVLHVYKRSEVTAALVEGRDALGLCGLTVHPETADGHIVPPDRTGNSVCLDCLGEVEPEEAMRILRPSKVKEGAQ